MDAFETPQYVFKKPPDGDIEKFKELSDDELTREDDRKSFLLCRNCKNKITSYEALIPKNGQYKHVFSNPEGVTFEISCFSKAPGCVNQGAPILQHTWFPGFSWRFSLCSYCRSQIGWYYQSRSGEGFYGLILVNMIEGGR